MNKLLKGLLCLFLVISLVGCKKETTKEEKKEEEIVEKEEENKKEEKKEEVKEDSKEEEKKEETKEEEKKEETKVEETKKEETTSSTSTTTTTPSIPSTPTTPSQSNTTTSKPLGQRSRCVVIDAGHGGSDPGCNNGSYLEKDITLRYALAIGQILSSQGIQVVYTRTNDTILQTDSYRLDDGTVRTNDLRARAELGEQYNAALYVSIHVDATSGYAKGYSVFAHTGHSDSVALANSINSELASLNYTTSKGVLNGSALRVIRCNTTISCLVELGFITGDLDILLNTDWQNKISNAIATGIVNKLNAGMIEPNKVLEKQPDLY